MCKPSNTIYLHKCESKLKCITAVDLKTTLDPSGKLPYINGCYVTIWEPKVTQAPSQNIKNALTSVAVPQLSQTPPDELVLPPVLVPKLQMETTKPPTTISIPYHTSQLEPLPSTSTGYKSEPLSLEMFNHAATDLNEKGVINLKRYKKYLYQKK